MSGRKIKRDLRRRAFDEAAALLAADMDDADLQCEVELSEDDASKVREYIRTEIVSVLKRKALRLTP